MLPLLMTLALATAPTAPKAPAPGPMPPAVKGLVKPMSLGADVKDYVRWSLDEMGQAVVVVEGELGLALPRIATGIKVFDGKLNLFRPRIPLPSDIPPASWVDMSAVGAPGNPAGKSYPIGWGY
jgi:hypothetical protein